MIANEDNPAELAVDRGSFVMRPLEGNPAQPDEVVVSIDPVGMAELDGRALESLSEGEAYQLWGQSVDGELISVAVLGHQPGFWEFPLPDDIEALHLTVEASTHGVVSSTETPVLSTTA